MLRYLRIAVTALSLTACVLLIALWVRSNSSLEWCRFDVLGGRTLQLQSARANIFVFAVPDQVFEQISSYPAPRVPDYGSIALETYNVRPEQHVPIIYSPPNFLLSRANMHLRYSVLGLCVFHICIKCKFLGSLEAAFLPSHTAHRHDAGGGGVGPHRVVRIGTPS
jgi:hypothetical protein